MTDRSVSTDKHVLYQKSVQDPVSEVRFFKRVFTKVRGRTPRILREDFCGTGAVSSEWVRRGRDTRAFGIDLHKPTIEWGLRHNVAPLGDAASRVELINGNVLDRYSFDADVVAALNFSYFTFKDRATMLHYVRGVHSSLADEGIFVLDIYGGPDAQTVQEEEEEYDDFVYIWDQARFNPVSGETLCYIHFKLPGKKMLRRAFTYDWRLWSLPEMRDIIEETGFKSVDVYWEGTDNSTGDGNGVFRRSTKGDDASSWLAYIVAAK